MPTLRARLSRWLPALALIAIAIGFVNFWWFFAETAALGGDALNGYTSDGHYYVVSHGTYTEVNRGAWEWNRVHAASLFVTHPAAMAGMAYVFLRFRRLIS
jgi:hypothetical protein